MKDYTIFNGRKLDRDVKKELEKKDQEILSLKKLNSMLIKGIKIDDRRVKEMIFIRDKKIEKLNKLLTNKNKTKCIVT